MLRPPRPTVVLVAEYKPDDPRETRTRAIPLWMEANQTLTLMRMRLDLEAAEAWWYQVDASQRLEWEYISLARADKARGLFFRYRDKDFSFTDCTSFVVMRELKLREVLTTDRHFAQAGFTVQP